MEQRKIRLAEERDKAAMLEIICQAKAYFQEKGIDQWQKGYPNEETVLCDIQGQHAYVLENKDGVVGMETILFGEEPTYVQIYEGAWLSEQPYATVHRMAVSDAGKGQGLSGELFLAAEELCKRAGVYSLRTDTHPENHSMQRAVEKQGFTCCGIIHLIGGEEDGDIRLAYEKLLEF